MANAALDRAIAGIKSVLRPDISLAEMRQGLDGLAAPVPGDVTLTSVAAGGVPSIWVAAPGAGQSVVLYFHGGGYMIGSATGYREFAGRLSRAAGARVLLVDYRLAPEHVFPAAVDDAVAAYRWLLDQGTSAGQIVIAGDSAGGGLTLATLIALREAGLALPAAAVTLSAWTDLAASGDSIVSRAALDPFVTADGIKGMAGAYLNGADPRTPLASPLYADFKGLPPLLMQVGTAEILYDDTIRVADRARAAGVEVTVEEAPGMVHVYQTFAAILPEGQQAIERIGAYVRDRVKSA